MNIIDNNNLLTSAQKQMLQEKALCDYKLGGFNSLNEILERLNVEVIIEPGIQTISLADFYEGAKRYWEDELGRNFSLDNNDEGRSLNKEYVPENMDPCSFNPLRNVNNESGSVMNLRGLYDSENKVIKLFPDEMKTEDGGDKIDVLLLSTLAHETMHAYFDRYIRRRLPYAPFIEEPLAEFGMLLYYYETKYADYQSGTNIKKVSKKAMDEASDADYKWCLNDVANKKSFYNLGAVLMLQYLAGDSILRDYLEAYKVRLNEFEMFGVENRKLKLPKSVKVGQTVVFPHWLPEVYASRPEYFYDDRTCTIGFRGVWKDYGCDYRVSKRLLSDIENAHVLYFEDSFSIEDGSPLDVAIMRQLKNRKLTVLVSPDNSRKVYLESKYK